MLKKTILRTKLILIGMLCLSLCSCRSTARIIDIMGDFYYCNQSLYYGETLKIYADGSYGIDLKTKAPDIFSANMIPHSVEVILKNDKKIDTNSLLKFSFTPALLYFTVTCVNEFVEPIEIESFAYYYEKENIIINVHCEIKFTFNSNYESGIDNEGYRGILTSDSTTDAYMYFNFKNFGLTKEDSILIKSIKITDDKFCLVDLGWAPFNFCKWIDGQCVYYPYLLLNTDIKHEPFEHELEVKDYTDFDKHLDGISFHFRIEDVTDYQSVNYDIITELVINGDPVTQVIHFYYDNILFDTASKYKEKYSQ